MKKITKLLLALMCFVMTSAMYGQGSTTSSMNGKVVDNNGAPLPGANVVAIHTPSGTRYGAATDFDGLFRISNMRVGGPYTVTISYVGFEDFTKENVYLQLGQTFRINANLKESGNALEEVVVTAQANSLFGGNKTGAETIINSKKLQTLPSTSRSVADFVRLTPQASISEGNDGFSISIAGQNNRFNAIYVDGAVNNDTFGLAGSGTNGGQTGVNPFSIDAIEQFQVSVAPFDVKIAGFTGGSINAITKSGKNELFGSAYTYFRNQSLVGKTPVDLVPSGESRENIADFTAKTYGFTLGGPIVKDKAFFFVNYERQDDETPAPFNPANYVGNSTAADLDLLVSTLQSRYGYNPGTYTDHLNTLKSDRIVSRFDFNINDNNKISLSYRLNKTENLEARGSNNFNIGFLNGSEFFNHIDHSGSIEWSSSIGSKYANSLIVGYTKVDDDRDPSGDPFPWVRIRDGSGRITFGGERFSTANLLKSDVLTITDNFEIYKGKHTLTIGTHNEFSSIKNLFFASNYGNYEYDNLAAFLNDENPRVYQRGYSLLSAGAGDTSSGSADFKLAQYGAYLQDEVQISNNFKLSVGVRFDMPVWDDGRVNEDFNTRTIPLLEAAGKDLQGATIGRGISSTVHVSPRVGFNWNVKGEYKTQVRGGFGVFVSRIPLVWPGGTYNNNGVTGGYTFRFRPDMNFNPDVNSQPVDVLPGTGAVGGNIDLFASDMKLPQVFKVNLALDQKLPKGFVLSADILYNDNLQHVYYENLNLKDPVSSLTGTGDTRPIYNRRDEIDDTYGRIILGSNTTEGYSWNATATISKSSKNFNGSVSYSYGDSYGIFDGTSSQNSSQWRNIQTVNGKNSNLPVTRSDFASGHRFTSFMAYDFEWAKIGKTTFSLFYEGQQGGNFSYIYRDGDDLLNDDSRGNALIYIPRNQGDINFVGTPAEQQEQWNALDNYISSNDYLNSRRGKYAERNGDKGPWNHVVDFKMVQEIKLGADSKHALALTFDIFNLTNLLNKNWGIRRFISRNVSLIEMEGFKADGTTPEFRFDPSVIDRIEQIDDFGLQSSRWQMNFGLKYTFN